MREFARERGITEQDENEIIEFFTEYWIPKVNNV